MEFKNGDRIVWGDHTGIYCAIHPMHEHASIVVWDESDINEINAVPTIALKLAPKTITLCGIEFPEPVREPLNVRDRYWHVNIGLAEICLYSWLGNSVDKALLRSGLIQLTKEGAELQLKAMIKSVGGEV